MNRHHNWSAIALMALMLTGKAAAALLPGDWQSEQPFAVSNSGLVKLSLPVETLDAARPALEDLRLYDDSGREIPYLTERPAPVVKIIRNVKSFRTSMQARTTVITIETGLAQPLEVVTLETPAMNFLKPVRVEASTDGKIWQLLAQGQPIFRQPNGASQLSVSFPSGVWPWLRLTVDDQRYAPIPFTGARVQATVIESAPTEWTSAAISERTENPGETRLALNLGAANLNIASVRVESADPLLTRHIALAVPQISEEAIREQPVGQGAIYKVAIDGQPASENLSVPLNAQIRSRELVMLIKNEDSPPLTISSIRIERRPVYLVFLAHQAGTYHLLTGNSRCAAPRYDLAALGMNLKSVAPLRIPIPPPAANPNFRAPEILAGIESNGAPLDVSEWKFRKPVKLPRSGAQQIELDLETLSRASTGFEDIRLLRDGKQVPYVIEHTSITRALTPEITATNDARHKSLSRWMIKLPQARLPIVRVQCSARTALFEREMTLYERVLNDRDTVYQRMLGSTLWIQKPDQSQRKLILIPQGSMTGDTMILETENGDNPPIELQNFNVFYPVTRILFRANSEDKIFLYYGRPNTSSPRYDLSLVADQLLSARKSTASLAPQEQLGKPSWSDNHRAGQGGVVFWGILALVVVALLAIIARLLPKSSAR